MSKRGEQRKKTNKQALRAQRYKAKLTRDAEAERNRNPPQLIPPGTIAKDSSGQPIGVVTGSTGLMQQIPSGWADVVRPVLRDFAFDMRMTGEAAKNAQRIMHTYQPPDDEDNGPEPIAKMK